jgi:hypothetical protein
MDELAAFAWPFFNRSFEKDTFIRDQNPLLGATRVGAAAFGINIAEVVYSFFRFCLVPQFSW